MDDHDNLSDFTLPGKRYFTISEVSELCQVKAHVLRYWEQEFAALNPQKRRGNRRYYTYDDIKVVRNIRSLLYEQGFSIVGARKQLASPPSASGQQITINKQQLSQAIAELESVIRDLNDGH